MDKYLEDITKRIIDILSTHYIFKKIDNIHFYEDGLNTIVNVDSPSIKKVEVYFEFKKYCSIDDKEFFMTRIHSNLSELRDELWDNNIFLTHLVSFDPERHSVGKFTINFFKEQIRNLKIESLIDS